MHAWERACPHTQYLWYHVGLPQPTIRMVGRGDHTCHGMVDVSRVEIPRAMRTYC